MVIPVACFVINLVHQEKRRQEISSQLQRLHIPFTIFPAVNGKTLSPDELATSYDKPRAIEASHDMTLGEIGCALSHIGVYREMIRLGIGHALVLEDDARLSDVITDILPRLREEYPAETAQIILLNHVEKYRKIGTRRLTGKHRIVHTYGNIQNAHGYFITRAAAEKLLSSLFPVWLVADQWRPFMRNGYTRIDAVVPYCIGLSEQASDSSLTADRVARMALYPPTGILYYLHRFLYRKFLWQLVRPLLRVARQERTW